MRESGAPGKGKYDERRIFRLLKDEITTRAPKIRVEERIWKHDDPTDYQALHDLMKTDLAALRSRFSGRPVYIHISPGTGAMQTMWVVAVGTGMMAGPVTMVKTLRPWERSGGPAAVPIRLEMSTLFKTLRRTRPAALQTADEQVFWDPSLFRSEALSGLYRRAKRIAQLKVPILLLGERGTGKTKLASWVRLHSPYRIEARDEAWPSVACGQYSGETIKAELFGYKKGAFTGADKDRDGLLKAAHGDTLFLDEVGDLGRDVQRLLIRAIEEHTFLPLGATIPERCDFRLITATNRPSDELRKILDPDFYDRISAFTLTLPPLCEMPEDVPWLWDKVYVEALRRSGHEVPPLPAAQVLRVVGHLQNHPLPGNLRDLFRVAYHLVEASIEVDEETPPLPPDKAVDYALDHGLLRRARLSDMARAAAGAFAHNEPLDGVLHDGPLHLDEIQKAFQHYLGTEVLRIARQTGRPVKDLCDRAERTLYDWKRGQPPTNVT